MTEVLPASPGTTRVGWIGTGVMGAAMCGHLLAAGYEVTVSTRTRARAQSLVAAGAHWAQSPREVALASDVIFTMLGYPGDVRDVILGPRGLMETVRAHTVVVDMSTSEPALAREIAEQGASRDVPSLDAPVSGGDVGAKNATLSIMVGGDQDVFNAVLPCFRVVGHSVRRLGSHGAGQHTKMTNQILVAANMVGVCEALLYAYRAGLDLEEVLAAVSGGAGASWALTNLAPRIVTQDMNPGFYVDHFVKDMGIALAEAARMKLALPGLALARQLYVALQSQGYGSSGTQALMLALASLSNIPWKQR